MKNRITAAVVVVAAVLGTFAAPAAAHYGDWGTQYTITSNRASAYFYVTSGTYGAHSRYFQHKKYVSGGYCIRHQKIGDDYYVWDDYTLCYY